jgi:hypothetical protein
MSEIIVDPFGDVRAEHDGKMLDAAFYEWAPYKALLADSSRFVVVGRRGTGKSALAYRLANHWKLERRFCISVAPQEEEFLGFRGVAALFGDSVGTIRAGVKLLWKYALIMELADALSKYYKSSSAISQTGLLRDHLNQWTALSGGIFLKLRKLNYEWLKGLDSPPTRLAESAERLKLNQLMAQLREVVGESKKPTAVLVDRLDEGYEPDLLGIGVVDGLVYGTSEFRENLGEGNVALVFLRDNIFRSLQQADNDFSRNIEPRALRLHWDPQELLYMTIGRLRVAFKIEKEGEIKTWNAFTENELHGVSGFKTVLRHTLYRPRDVIALLNGAFFEARRQSRKTLIQQDITAAARSISRSRLDDLEKEYDSVFPGLSLMIDRFHGQDVHLTIADVRQKIFEVLASESLEPRAHQHLLILSKENAAVQALYGIGFLGLKNDISKTFVFCHDGRQLAKALSPDTEVIVHPCYWAALGSVELGEDEHSAEEIFDEYEVTIYSADADQRSQILGRHISALASIPAGDEGASDFEDWCLQAVNFCFSYQLSNVALHPNKVASQRRDIVATNLGSSSTWRRILEDYNSRQIVFEVKNYEDLGVAEFRQVHGYLGREYGRLGFVICRGKHVELDGAESAAFREFYKTETGSVIVKLTAVWLTNNLSKLRSPQKHDHADVQLAKLLDEYIRVYANEQLIRKLKSRTAKVVSKGKGAAKRA